MWLLEFPGSLVKNPGLSLLSLLWREFDLWPENFHMPCAEPPQKGCDSYTLNPINKNQASAHFIHQGPESIWARDRGVEVVSIPGLPSQGLISI